MTFLDLVKKRYSVRAYSSQSIEPEKLQRCMEAVRLAPSACNSQPWKFIIIDDPKIKNNVAEQTFELLTNFNKFTLQAPVIAVVVATKPKLIAQIGGRIKSKDYYLYDIGIAAEHFCLQATEEGLGTCMIGWFREKAIKKILNIPSSLQVALVIAVGYPEGNVKEKIRKKPEEILSFNQF